MATLAELADFLPNGLHDAMIRTCAIDYVERQASFEVDVWVGNMSSSGPSREARRLARLVLTGLAFIQIEPPDPAYPYGRPEPLTIDLCDPEPSDPVVSSMPAGTFVSRLFVSNWNAFIHVAATHAELTWVER